MLLREKMSPATANRVDRTTGVIREVLVCGLVSAKGYDYPPDTLREALPQYENVGVHVDHQEPGARRSYRDKVGTIRGVRFVEGRGLVGDLYLNQAHPLYEQILWDAENAPENFGLSHDTRGSVANDPRTGRRFVDKIDKVLGVDIVSRPATTRGIFEDRNGDGDSSPGPFAHLRESRTIKAARISRTVERFTRTCSEPLPCAGGLQEDQASTVPVPVPVPPVGASLAQRIRRFQRS